MDQLSEVGLGEEMSTMMTHVGRKFWKTNKDHRVRRNQWRRRNRKDVDLYKPDCSHPTKLLVSRYACRERKRLKMSATRRNKSSSRASSYDSPIRMDSVFQKRNVWSSSIDLINPRNDGSSQHDDPSKDLTVNLDLLKFFWKTTK